MPIVASARDHQGLPPTVGAYRPLGQVKLNKFLQLQRMIRQAFSNGRLSHLVDSSLPRPSSSMSMVDDTLIICHALPLATSHLIKILDNFALATGLTINFHKSCLIPVNVGVVDATAIASILQRPISIFPQPYLGLALLPLNLPNSAFNSILTSFDHRLSGGVLCCSHREGGVCSVTWF